MAFTVASLREACCAVFMNRRREGCVESHTCQYRADVGHPVHSLMGMRRVPSPPA